MTHYSLARGKMKTVLQVREIPPYKQTPADRRERQNQEMRADALKVEANRQFGSLLRGNLRLTIEYHRHRGRSDAANIIGGIADALNKIAYDDDRQIVEIHYREAKGDVDWYQVVIEEA